MKFACKAEQKRQADSSSMFGYEYRSWLKAPLSDYSPLAADASPEHRDMASNVAEV